MIYYLTQLLPFVLIGAFTIGSLIRFTDFDAEHFDGMFDSLSADYMSQVGPVNEERYSNCCGASDIHDGNLDNNEGVCADCGEHCEMEEVVE